MIVNCFYEEEEQYPDIIFIPEKGIDVSSIQKDFFSWVFDESRSNAAFSDIGGIKGCSYDTVNFVYWLNEFFLAGTSEKAYIVEKNADKWDSSNEQLFF